MQNYSTLDVWSRRQSWLPGVTYFGRPCDALAAKVYVLNRDTASRLAISSPLEAHKAHSIIFHTCGVDVGFDNPVFAVSISIGLVTYTCL